MPHVQLSQPLPDKVNLFIVNEVFGPKKLYQQAKTDNGQFAVLFLGDKNGVEYKLSKCLRLLGRNCIHSELQAHAYIPVLTAGSIPVASN